MTKSVKEWMNLLTESISNDVEQLIEDPQVDEYYFFVSNAGVDLRGRIIAVDGYDYTLEVDGEIYHVPYENIGQKSFAGEITESEEPCVYLYGKKICVGAKIEFQNESGTEFTGTVISFYSDDDGETVAKVKDQSGRVHDIYPQQDILQILDLNESVLTEAKTLDEFANGEYKYRISMRDMDGAIVVLRMAKTSKGKFQNSDMLATNGRWIAPSKEDGYASIKAKEFDSTKEAKQYITGLTESVLTEALSTKQIVAALAMALGLSTTAHAGLLSDMAASIEAAAPKVGAAIVANAQKAATAAGEVYDEQSPKVIAAAKDAAQATKDAVAKYGPKIIDGAKSAGMTTADYVAKYYNEKSPEVIAGAKKLGVSTAEYIKMQTPEVIAAAKKAGVSTGDYLVAQYDDKSPAVKAAAKKAAKAAGDAVGDVADRSSRAAKEFVK